MGRLSYIFLIAFWLLNTIPLEFSQKIQDAGDIRVGRKSFILPQKFENRDFSKISFLMKIQGCMLVCPYVRETGAV
jgi:hypothetical protein